MDHSPLYDTDLLRVFLTFLNLDEDDDDEDSSNFNQLRDEREMVYDFDSPGSPKQSSLVKFSKLLDNYLAVVALDTNLTPSKLTALADLLPDHARVVYDGLYRAVDIFLKDHPNMKDSERYRLCKTIDCQKLSQEACSHAAQNKRLPVQMVVQDSKCSGSGAGSGCISPRGNYASVRQENRELKLEVARMRLTDLVKDHVSMKQELVRTHPMNRLFKSFTRKLSKLHLWFRVRDTKAMGGKTGNEGRFLFQRRRRHSVS